MDETIREVDKLTVHKLQHELRKRRLMVSGIKADLRRRLIEDLRIDYDNGWTCGKLLSMRLIPFNGDGIDPQTLIGLHVTSIGPARSHTNVKLSFSNGDSLIICSRPTTTAADPVYFFFCDSASTLKWPCVRSPMRILEAAMAEMRNDKIYPGPHLTDTVLVLRVEGMGRLIYIGNDRDEGQ